LGSRDKPGAHPDEETPVVEVMEAMEGRDGVERMDRRRERMHGRRPYPVGGGRPGDDHESRDEHGLKVLHSSPL
jgi:hypothetical protein